MTKPSSLFPSSSSSSKLGIMDQSQVIAKLKPKIRVIHVDAPKVIQTDAANFRDLVQRLTGKPGDNIIRRTTTTMAKEEEQDFLAPRNKNMIKNEEDEEDHDDEISRESKSNKEIRFSGFFDHHHGLSAELDGFMEQLSTMN